MILAYTNTLRYTDDVIVVSFLFCSAENPSTKCEDSFLDYAGVSTVNSRDDVQKQKYLY